MHNALRTTINRLGVGSPLIPDTLPSSSSCTSSFGAILPRRWYGHAVCRVVVVARKEEGPVVNGRGGV